MGNANSNVLKNKSKLSIVLSFIHIVLVVFLGLLVLLYKLEKSNINHIYIMIINIMVMSFKSISNIIIIKKEQGENLYFNKNAIITISSVLESVVAIINLVCFLIYFFNKFTN
ncbi:hypothetical protein [Clostridium cochlearium]|uniref:Uncharacterized protein n=1 Tax=Clostridium cochlearium TaxID=1494 RepID=A0A2X2YFD2_CLOCO|nr:hypothetical protein [Clostridium cochlearium]MBU5269659.1 hypothetical protein [Clostridium cochlearium]SQB36639.1 Uncharacterised protein [Clostridium cochlearium]